MSQIVHEVRHFIVHEGENVAMPTHEDLAAEAQRLAKGGHIVSMTVPGGNVVQVGPDDDAAEVTDRFQKALPKPKAAEADDETKSRGKGRP
jgi:hypothetical protein